MDFEQLKEYCLNKKGVKEEFPFDFVNPVYKVGSKIFAIISMNEDPLRINLKCDPAEALFLREKYKAITAGYHMNKKHWNSIYMDKTIPSEEIIKMIDHSYDLIFKKLSRKERDNILDS